MSDFGGVLKRLWTSGYGIAGMASPWIAEKRIGQGRRSRPGLSRASKLVERNGKDGHAPLHVAAVPAPGGTIATRARPDWTDRL